MEEVRKVSRHELERIICGYLEIPIGSVKKVVLTLEVGHLVQAEVHLFGPKQKESIFKDEPEGIKLPDFVEAPDKSRRKWE